MLATDPICDLKAWNSWLFKQCQEEVKCNHQIQQPLAPDILVHVIQPVSENLQLGLPTLPSLFK